MPRGGLCEVPGRYYLSRMPKHHWISDDPLALEQGGTLEQLEITYHTYGTLRPGSRVIWVCHALTASSDVADWWSGLIGEGAYFDPERDFIVCANILGSCYGSSGPLTLHPHHGRPYYSAFPNITIRDMVAAHDRLRAHLGIEQIDIAMGGSMGGYQVLEWAIMHPERIGKLILMVTGASESAWGQAIHATQRMAIENDPTWADPTKEAGNLGLMTARALGMLTYRNYETFVATQATPEPQLTDHRAASYVQYQGKKLADRFHAYSYWLLSLAMDGHHVGRDRGPIKDVLGALPHPALVIGISSDILCPPPEQRALAFMLPHGQFVRIDSPYGHDGFLLEYEQITKAIDRFLG